VRYNPFRDYDKHGCLKLPWTFFVALAFLCRSYVVWVVALSYRQDSGGLLSLFYPSRSEFSAALIVAIPALTVALIASLRRVGMGWFIEHLWQGIRQFMAGAASIQLCYALWLGNLSSHNLKHIGVTYPIIVEMVGMVLVIAYCMLNQRFRDVSKQFPHLAQHD